MLHDLPKEVQRQILHYLTSDNFVAAKDLRDIFIQIKKRKAEKNDWGKAYQPDILDLNT